MEESLQITTVIIIPRTPRYARYILNDGSSHALKYEALEIFLKKLIPSKSDVINEYLFSFQHFYMVVPEMLVEKFVFDFDGEREKFRKQNRLRQFDPQYALRLIESRSKATKNDINKIFEKLAQKFDRKSYEKILGLAPKDNEEIRD